jgi:hypothetical protein
MAALSAGLVTGVTSTGGTVAGGLSSQSSCASNGSWPEYQGDATHQANACSSLSASNVATLRPAWYYGTAGTVTASPAVVNGVVYDGDSSGIFYAVNQATGTLDWSDSLTASAGGCFIDQPLQRDQHNATAGNGVIAGSPAVQTVNGVPTVYVPGAGALFALNATTGACLWAQDVDPASPTNTVETESSPVLDLSVNPPEVIIGDDENSNSRIAVTGIQAFNAVTGALLWRYQPERDAVLYPSEFASGSPAIAGLSATGLQDYYALSCGDGTTNPDCTPTTIANIAPNQALYGDGCGDVWSSPALDTSYVDPAGDNRFQGSSAAGPTTTPPAGSTWQPTQITTSGTASLDGLVVFGTGNCAVANTPAVALSHGDYVDNQGVFALDPLTGVRVWDFVEPYNIYDNNENEPGGGDDDFGASAVLAGLPATSVPASACAPVGNVTTLVLEGSKDGFAYGLCEDNGGEVWQIQASQPGQVSPDTVGSVGGFLGSPALGMDNGRLTAFFTSAIPLPFTNDGIREPNDGDTNISSCPGPILDLLPLLPACPDLTVLNDPERLLSLHAVDAATGKEEWHGLSVPTYAAASYTNGVVFEPETLGFGILAVNANNGLPLWAFPTLSSLSSEAAIVGNSIVFGAGTQQAVEFGLILPFQLNGLWDFSTTAPLIPSITRPPSPTPNLSQFKNPV